MKYEKVFSINDWYDGPRLGIANFSGEPHVFKSIWNEKREDWEPFYYLKPIDQKYLKFVKQDRDIWKKFESSFINSKSKISEHPALTKGKHYKDLETKLNGIFEIDYSSAIKVNAEFKYNNEKYVVHWETIVNLNEEEKR